MKEQREPFFSCWRFGPRLTYILLIYSSLAIAKPAYKSFRNGGWVGSFRKKDGVHAMKIEQWDNDGLDVEIVDTRRVSSSRPVSMFLANIHGAVAKAQFRHSPECKVNLIHKSDGIEVIDQCGGKVGGIYELDVRK